MSHNRRNTTAKGNSFEGMFYSGLLFCLMAVFGLFAAQANAAEVTATKIQKNANYVLKSSLGALSDTDKAVLDWRSNSYTLSFDLPAHDWYDDLDLFISAYPEGNVSKTTPLTIRYNGTDPIQLQGRGSQFDAQISLNTARIRTAGNKIEIIFPAPDGASCVGENDGRWVIDLSRSKLVAKARAKNRNMQMREIEPRLRHPMTAPRRVALIAMGTNKSALEALAAQGIALRMDTVPQYQFRTAASDFQVIIGTHKQITPYVKTSDWTPRDSAQAFITKDKHARLVLTAPTDAQVLELSRVFSAYQLPNTSRRSISKNEFYAYPKFSPRTIVGAQTYDLPQIGNARLTQSWRPKPAQLSFNVADPSASHGTLTLNIISSKGINPDSRVRVLLNEQSIGYTLLNKSKKTVAFDIKSGLFQAADNHITIEPVIGTDGADMTCAHAARAPVVHISSRSNLKVKNDNPTPLTDIRRFAASGAPFNAPDTTIVLTAKTQKDRASALRFLGYAAQQFGPAWSEANFTHKMPVGAKLEQNILIIGPNVSTNSDLMATAPSALKLALRGKTIDIPNARTASLDRHASLDSDAAFRLAANQRGAHTKLGSGGIASVYPSPYAKGKFIGIISADKTAAYPMAMKTLSTPKYWNALQGSVTRWDTNTIVMAQTASSSPSALNFAVPAPAQTAPAARPGPQIAVAPAAAKAPLALRGATSPYYGKTAQAKKAKAQKQSFTLPKLPSLTTLKIKTRSAYDSSARYVKNVAASVNMHAAKRFWNDLIHNRPALLIILAFSVFLLIGLASPKSARRR